jgi:hypothetical protein
MITGNDAKSDATVSAARREQQDITLLQNKNVCVCDIGYSAVLLYMPCCIYSVSLGKQNETGILFMIHDNSCTASNPSHSELPHDSLNKIVLCEYQMATE